MVERLFGGADWFIGQGAIRGQVDVLEEGTEPLA